jgi:hypothetical protein
MTPAITAHLLGVCPTCWGVCVAHSGACDAHRWTTTSREDVFCRRRAAMREIRRAVWCSSGDLPSASAAAKPRRVGQSLVGLWWFGWGHDNLPTGGNQAVGSCAGQTAPRRVGAVLFGRGTQHDNRTTGVRSVAQPPGVRGGAVRILVHYTTILLYYYYTSTIILLLYYYTILLLRYYYTILYYPSILYH